MYRARTRKRVHAIPRGPDGSAFQKCESCGLLVAIALVDMHECESKDNVKRFKGGGNLKRLDFEDQPRSAFRFFMEELVKVYEEDNEIAIDRMGFERWKKMSQEERQPYFMKAEKVNSSHTKALVEEENNMLWVDDEADSAEVGKYDENYEQGEHCDDSKISESFLFWSETSNSYFSIDWGKRLLNQLKK